MTRVKEISFGSDQIRAVRIFGTASGVSSLPIRAGFNGADSLQGDKTVQTNIFCMYAFRFDRPTVDPRNFQFGDTFPALSGTLMNFFAGFPERQSGWGSVLSIVRLSMSMNCPTAEKWDHSGRGAITITNRSSESRLLLVRFRQLY